jgi:hypothetical protein
MIHEVWERDLPEDKANYIPPLTGTAQMEILIKIHIYCELKRAIQKTLEYPIPYFAGANGPLLGKKPLIPPKWIAQVALSLQVDEASAVSGGITLVDVLPNATIHFPNGNVTSGQSRSQIFGASASTTATRTDKFNFSYSVDKLKEFSPESICLHPENKLLSSLKSRSSPLIEGELGIEKWLVGALVADAFVPSTGDAEGTGTSAPADAKTKASKGGKSDSGKSTGTDAISEEIKFVIVTSGNFTPSWKLIRLTANNSGNFVNATRTRTHDLIITIGPNTLENSYAHLASQIGAAVGSRSGN